MIVLKNFKNISKFLISSNLCNNLKNTNIKTYLAFTSSNTFYFSRMSDQPNKNSEKPQQEEQILDADGKPLSKNALKKLEKKCS